jgi:phosphohistidine phosphatase
LANSRPSVLENAREEAQVRLLYLVQHGEALPEDADPDRHLSEKGAADVEKVARFLRPMKLSMAAVWHSGKPRAQQTAEVLAGALTKKPSVVQRDGLSPKDPVAPVRKAVEGLGEDLMIVGHLPLLGKLAASLVTGDKSVDVVTFRYGGVVCLENTDGGDGWTVAWMIVPDLILA